MMSDNVEIKSLKKQRNAQSQINKNLGNILSRTKYQNIYFSNFVDTLTIFLFACCILDLDILLFAKQLGLFGLYFK